MLPLELLLTQHEGLRLKPYPDSYGNLTIGIGRNLDANGITYDEARFLFHNDIDAAIHVFSKTFTYDEEVAMGVERRDAILDMIFNLGATRFRQFRNTIAHLKAGRYPEAATHMLRSKWASQVGTRANDLANIVRTGRYPAWLYRKLQEES